MPKKRGDLAGGVAWRPSVPPGRYLSRKQSMAMMRSVADIAANGKASVWYGVESWDESVRLGILEWSAKNH